MFKLFFELFILPLRIMGWFIKAIFWIPLLLLGFTMVQDLEDKTEI